MLGILAFHVSEFTGQLGNGIAGRFDEVAGGEAVLLFFAISGFLLYRPYVAAHAAGRAGPSTGIYARRRALRILPGYWAVLTLLAIFPGIVGVFSGDWWRYYGYLQLYSTRTIGGGIPVAWTLCVEVTFYLALPLWALAIRRLAGLDRGRFGERGWLAAELLTLTVVAAAGAAVQLAAAGGAIGYLVGVSLAGECLWIAIGMAFAVLSVAVQRDAVRLRLALRRVNELPGVCWLIAAAAFAGMMALVPHGGLSGLIATTQVRQSLHLTAVKIVLGMVLVSMLIAPAVFGDASRGAPRRLLRFRPIVWLGVISYSFYLWHLTIVELIATPGKGGSFSDSGLNLLAHLHSARTLILYVLSFVATAVVAAASYRWVELPFLRRK